MKHTMKLLLSVLLVMTMACVLLPGMMSTAHAETKIKLTPELVPSSDTYDPAGVTLSVLFKYAEDGEGHSAGDPVDDQEAPAYTLNPATLESAGEKTVTVALQGDEANAKYELTTDSLQFTLLKKTITADEIVWPSASAMTYGDALGDTLLVSTDNTQGTFAFAPNQDANVQCPSFQATVVFTPNNNHQLQGGAATATKQITVEVNKLTLTGFSLTTTSADYNPQAATTVSGLAATVSAGSKTLNANEYTLTCADGTTIQDAKAYTIEVSLPANSNYQLPEGGLTASYTINKLNISSVTLTATSKNYDGQEIDVTTLGGTVKAGATGNITLDAADYELQVTNNNKDCGNYNVTVHLTNDNYTDTNNVSANFTINQITVTGLNLSESESDYDGQAVDMATLANGATVTTDGVDFDEQLTLTCAAGEVKDAAEYTITPVLGQNSNFKLGTDAKATYTVKAVAIEQMELSSDGKTYDRTQVTLGTDLTASFKATVNGQQAVVTPTYALTCDKTILDADVYTVKATVSGSNYTIDSDATAQTYTIAKDTLTTTLGLNPSTSAYNSASAVAPATLSGTVTTVNDLTLNADEFTLTCDETIQNVGSYDVYVQLTEKGAKNFETGATAPTAVYEVTPIGISTVVLSAYSRDYDKDVTTNASDLVTKVLDAELREIPADCWELEEDLVIHEAKAYEIKAKIKSGVTNYTGTGSTSYNVKQVNVTSLTLGKTENVYNQETLTDFSQLNPSLKYGPEGQTVELIYGTDYTLTCADTVKDAKAYTLTVQLTNTNYSNTANVQATYTITPAQVNALTLTDNTSVYNQAEVVVTSLASELTTANNLTVPTNAYTLTCTETVKDAKEYTIGVQLSDTVNYAVAQGATLTDTYTVTKAPLTTLTFAQNNAAYRQAAYTDEDFKAAPYAAVVKAQADSEITVPAEAYTLAGNTDVLTAGSYTISVTLTEDGAENYKIDADVTAEFTVNKATVTTLAFGQNNAVYRQTAYTDTDFKADPYAAVVTAQANSDDEILTVPAEAYTLADAQGQDVLTAGEYTISVTLTQDGAANYQIAQGATVSAAFTINKATLTALAFGQNNAVYRQTAYADADFKADPYAAVVSAQVNAADETITVPATAYTLAEAQGEDVLTAGDYTISVTLTETGAANYQITSDVTADFTVNKATLTTLVFGQNNAVYRQTAYTDTDFKAAPYSAVVSAQANSADETLTVPAEAYTLAEAEGEDVLTAGDYTISVTLTQDGAANYQIAQGATVTAAFTVNKATLTTLVFGQNNAVYRQTAYTDVDFKDDPYAAVVTAQANSADETLTVPAEAYTLADAEGQDVLTAGEYTISVTLTQDGAANYQIAQGATVSAAFTVNKATLTGLTFGQDNAVYRQTAYTDEDFKADPYAAVVTAQANSDDEILTVPAEAYTLADAQGQDVLTVGQYTISVTLTETGAANYQITSDVTADFTVNKATLTTLAFGQDNAVYRQSAYTDEDFKGDPYAAVVTAQVNAADETITVPATAYTLAEAEGEDVLTAGEYTISVTLTEDGAANYQIDEAVTATFTVNKATLTTLVFGQNNAVYRQTAYTDVDFKAAPYSAVVTAQANSADETLTVPAEAYTLAGNAEVLTAGQYTISVALTEDGAANYQIAQGATVTAAFTINKATLTALTFEQANAIYRRTAYTDTDFKGDPYGAAVTAQANSADETLDVPTEAYTLAGNTDVLNVGQYTISVTLTQDGAANYQIAEGAAVTNTFDIWRLPVATITITVEGPEAPSDGTTNRLGGPNDAYNTITLTGEPNEVLIFTVQGAENTKELTLDNAGQTTIDISAIKNLGLELDESGDTKYTISAAYKDAANLTNAETAAANAQAPDEPESYFYYDKEAKPIVVGRLVNRGASGVPVTLAEDYTVITFERAAGEDGTSAFTATLENVAANTTVIPFAEGVQNRMASTEKNGVKYSGSYTDLVGNTGTIEDLEVYKATVAFNNIVEPEPNDNQCIGQTASLTWSFNLVVDGGSDENVNLAVNGRTVHSQTFNPGDVSFVCPTSALPTDQTLQVVFTCDDLDGNGTCTKSFIYDPVCDDPVITTTLYEGCYILSGLVEQHARVLVSFGDGYDRKVNPDAFGTIYLDMPFVEAGDVITLTVIDKADNSIQMTLVVGEEMDPVPMKAFMMGKTYTNAHKLAQKGKQQAPDWTQILQVSAKELRQGFTLPIVAGNAVVIGEITVKMDDQNVISYSYELEDGVELEKEIMVMMDKADEEAAISLQGTVISKDGTRVAVKEKGKMYLTAQFDVRVPADLLETSFLSADANDPVKKSYRERQLNKTIK